jgi:hypothetical protein
VMGKAQRWRRRRRRRRGGRRGGRRIAGRSPATVAKAIAVTGAITVVPTVPVIVTKGAVARIALLRAEPEGGCGGRGLRGRRSSDGASALGRSGSSRDG